ncbi:MAG: GIY-YIG nuclease family protein [bacterium]
MCNNFYYVYILKSIKDGKFYTGYTSDLIIRVEQHNAGMNTSTRNRRPFEFIYFEGALNKYDAIHREKYLKSTYGKRYIKNRLKNYFSYGNTCNINE